MGILSVCLDHMQNELFEPLTVQTWAFYLLEGILSHQFVLIFNP